MQERKAPSEWIDLFEPHPSALALPGTWPQLPICAANSLELLWPQLTIRLDIEDNEFEHPQVSYVGQAALGATTVALCRATDR